MLVDERYRKSVAFLCLADPEVAWRPVGSGFFVAMPVTETKGVLYVVTARHVVENARPLGSLHLRLNKRNHNETSYEAIVPDAWHVSQETDIAIARVPPQLVRDFDIQWFRESQFATSEVVAKQQVGPGDEVFFSGLFTSFPGIKRAEPVIRFGTISMMPNEPVPIENADKSKSHVEAFLVEARSWGGQSGSPAFVYFPPTRHPGFLELPSIQEGGAGGLDIPDSVMPQLLGIVSGHFNLEADVAFTEDIGAQANVPINTGIAIVIPSQKILDLLMEEEVVVERYQVAQ